MISTQNLFSALLDTPQKFRKIPFVDLKSQLRTVQYEVDLAMSEVLESGQFIGGPVVERFESEFAKYCGTKCCITVGSGTDALSLVLKALDIGPGDEVITTPHTFIATVASIVQTGASVVFADIDPITYCIDPISVASKITKRTKAIIPVHIYGHPADMDMIVEIARNTGVFVLEDAAQAHGAKYKGRMAGGLGHAAAFSFYPAKNLGALGDGGGITTSDPQLADKIRRLRDHGRVDKYTHREFGSNSRLDAIQAAVLTIKLRHLDAWNARRRHVAAKYGQLLGELEHLVVPFESEDVESAWHLYCIRTNRRSALQVAFDEAGIGHGIHYPIPVHLQPAWTRHKGGGLAKGTFPLIEQYASQILSLPMHEHISDEDIEYIADIVHSIN